MQHEWNIQRNFLNQKTSSIQAQVAGKELSPSNRLINVLQQWQRYAQTR